MQWQSLQISNLHGLRSLVCFPRRCGLVECLSHQLIYWDPSTKNTCLLANHKCFGKKKETKFWLVEKHDERELKPNSIQRSMTAWGQATFTHLPAIVFFPSWKVLACNCQQWIHSFPDALVEGVTSPALGPIVQSQRIRRSHELGFCITWKCSCQEQVHRCCTVKLPARLYQSRCDMRLFFLGQV